MIWKHRNNVFVRGQPSVADLMSKIKEEASLLARVGALGLSVALPTTCDVH
jgi:hypothetical protein